MAISQTGEALARTLADGEPGTYLVGEFLGLREQRERTVGDQTYRNADVRLLMGSAVLSVQFDSMEEAQAAVAGAADRDVIAVRAINRFGVKDGKAWQFWAGPRRQAA